LATPRTRVIAVANQKGGVGKSTTAVSLGAALAELGHKVLVVDLDPQGNASTGLGIRHDARQVTVYDVLAAEAPIDGAIVETPIENLFAIPSTIDLAGAEIELVSQFSRELRLRKAIEPLKQSEFTYILLDCPPSLGLLTVNALGAAEELIVPIQCEYYALEGLGQLLRNVRLVQQNVNSRLRLTGIVMTMYDPRTKLSDQVVQEVRRYFGERVYDTIIPRTVRLSEAPGFGLPITEYDPRSRGAQSYRELAAEVAAKLPDDAPLPVVDDIPTVVVPPPEQPPARAPRPLVSEEDEIESSASADEEIHDEPREGIRNEPADAAPEVHAVPAESPATVDADLNRHVEPPRSPPEPDVETSSALAPAPSGDAPVEPDASPVDSGGSMPTAESDRRTSVTVIGDEGEAADAAGDRERVGGEARSEPGEPERKKGWGLFRKGDRGGDR
jgi:chromosome partitioning protein